MPEPALRRHDLVWLHAAAAAECAVAAGPCSAAVADAGALLAAWIAAGRPLIATRQAASLAPGRVQLGLALPPRQGKLRLAFIVPAEAIGRIEAPPLLATVCRALPPFWQAEAARLLALAPIEACAPRVFGSAAIGALTGLDTLGAQSDLDLLFEPSSRTDALAVLDALRVHAFDVRQPRIDGEIRNPVGQAVAWRELAGAIGKVLVKHDRDEPCLIERTAFAAGFSLAHEGAL